jgi:2-oxoisovalerate dehydrogenase E2 component (dihydrolipoyl transacylase)
MGVRSIKMPDVGEGVAEAEIVEWAVKVGDLVREDQVVAAVMTDKATVEVPTPVAGAVIALGGAVGDILAVGSELIRIDAPGLPDALAPAAPKAASVRAERAPAQHARPKPIEPAPPAPEPQTEAPPRPVQEQGLSTPLRAREPQTGAPRPLGEKPLASPAVRMKAREAGVDLRFVRGSGPAGRITHEDLDAFIARPPEAPPKGPGRAPNTAVETIKIVGLRRRIAQNMAESSRRVAHFSYVEEVDVTGLEELRASLNAHPTEERPKLTMLPFLMLAIVKAVADFPQVNAHYDDDDVIQRFGAVHLGVATQTSNGLVVPVVRHAETLGLYACASEMRRVSEAARQGIAKREELTGSTITLTSLGALGGIASTPVVNRPEVAIVGVNKIVVKPVWRDGGFVPRKTMNLSSSFDHRVVDGYDAATFIQRVRELVEAPAALFIED